MSGFVQPVSPSAAMPPGRGALPRVSSWVGAIVFVQLVVLVATSTRYGYHPDEMYFIVAGAHPAFGYPDQPSLVPLLSWAMHEIGSGSLLVLRLPSALAAAATTLVAALLAREIGGHQRPQLIAACCTASSGFALSVGHYVTTTTFDMLSTSIVGWLLIRGISKRSGPALLMAGIVTGIGFEAKPQVAFVAAVAVIALLVVGPRWPLRSPWLVAGVGAAIVLAAPYLIWQAIHGWPQLTVASNIGGTAEGGRAGFVPYQFLLVSPVLAPVWIAGLVTPIRRASQRSLRFVPLTYAILALAYLVGNGKAYYLASLYPVLLGVGAIAAADWTLRVRRRRPARTGRPRTRTVVLTVGIVVSAAVSAYIALPLLPTTSLQGSAVMAINPDQGQTVGWPRFIDTVTGAWQSIPAAERAHTVIFAADYSEAGAIDILGHSHRLPRAYSGPTDAAPAFASCTTLATINDRVGLDNDEQGLPVLLCQPTKSWTMLWPLLRHYD
jgi:4-amino-4-deoxy-L-arabinose transferase-like glycosyltransferase